MARQPVIEITGLPDVNQIIPRHNRIDPTMICDFRESTNWSLKLVSADVHAHVSFLRLADMSYVKNIASSR
jgi:hypothetical protein